MQNKTLVISGKFNGSDILSIDQFTTADIRNVLRTAKKLKPLRESSKSSQILSGHIISLLFYEPSTRTFSSFTAAAQQLGAGIIPIHDIQSSSVAKGETLADTISVMESYSDAIVIRHPDEGSAQIAADIAHIPVINAGDGKGEHPTQALLDLLTIEEHAKRLTNLTGVMTGDLLNGRTTHSLIKALSLFEGNTLYLLSPKKLRLSEKHIATATSKKIKLIEIEKVEDLPHNADFWYWTRVQKERFEDVKEYEKLKHKFILTPALIRKYAGKKTIFMHPLPRVGEIDTLVDSDSRAVYLSSQMKNGVYIRMALLALVLGKIA